MASFAGWEMPLEYEGTLAEHASVRERVGLFDVSHLGKLMVTGPEGGQLLDEVLSNRIADLSRGRARYTLMLDEAAGIIDDLIAYAVAPERMLLVPNASNVDEVEARLRKPAGAATAIERLEWVTLALQGPESPQALRDVLPDVSELGYMRCAEVGEIIVARTGYTGEVGFELFASADRGRALWRELLDAVIVHDGLPCGLGARDTLRLEMGYPLHGNDLDRDTTPREAGLEWAVADEKPSFVGKEAHLGREPRKTLVGLSSLDRLIPRHGHAVFRAGDAIGTVSSGGFSPTLRHGIAMAYVRPGSVAPGDEVEIAVRGRRSRAKVVALPFVDRSPKGAAR
jgi:glycine cleavage system T protein (aminomethyltransferase)